MLPVIMVMVQVADLSHENLKLSRVMRWWHSRLSSHIGAKSSRECKPKWLSGLAVLEQSQKNSYDFALCMISSKRSLLLTNKFTQGLVFNLWMEWALVQVANHQASNPKSSRKSFKVKSQVITSKSQASHKYPNNDSSPSLRLESPSLVLGQIYFKGTGDWSVVTDIYVTLSSLIDK